MLQVHKVVLSCIVLASDLTWFPPNSTSKGRQQQTGQVSWRYANRPTLCLLLQLIESHG